MHAAELMREANPKRPLYREKRTVSKRKSVNRPLGVQTRTSKSYSREICALLLCIALFLSLNLFLLGRFAEVTAVKHRVSQMEKLLEQQVNQKEQLMVEIERSSKLEWIEEEAVHRLGMRYPDKTQMIYISVDPARVELVSGNLDNSPSVDHQDHGLLPHSIERIFHKFAGVLRI